MFGKGKYQQNLFNRIAVRQVHIQMFYGFVIGRQIESSTTGIKEMCNEFIDMYDLDIESINLYNQYINFHHLFIECNKKQV